MTKFYEGGIKDKEVKEVYLQDIKEKYRSQKEGKHFVDKEEIRDFSIEELISLREADSALYEVPEEEKAKKYRPSSTRKERKKYLVKLLGGRCEKCGYDKNMAALDFHHTSPFEKDFGITEAINAFTKKQFEDLVVPEVLERCELLCANCHRELHSDYLGEATIIKH